MKLARRISEAVGMALGAFAYRRGWSLPDPDCAAPIYSLTFNRRCGWLAEAMTDEYHGRPFRADMGKDDRDGR